MNADFNTMSLSLLTLRGGEAATGN